MPGSANFAGEFLILLGAFSSMQAIAIVASLGVILASVYALRMYIRSMHNRVGPTRDVVRDLTLRDGLVLVPLVAAILAFALYPQLALEAGEEAVKVDRAGGGAMTGLLAQATVKGPRDRLGGAVARDRADRRRVHRAARRPRALARSSAARSCRSLTIVDAGRDRRARRSGSGTSTRRSSPRALVIDNLTLR